MLLKFEIYSVHFLSLSGKINNTNHGKIVVYYKRGQDIELLISYHILRRWA